MSELVELHDRDGACGACLRRGWLLAELGPLLDCACRADARLLDTLALGDAELIAALGGSRREELRRGHAASHAHALRLPAGVETTCRHDARCPPAARGLPGLAALHVRGGAERLRALGARQLVAFAGRAHASDYGIGVAASLARELAAAGVGVAAPLHGAIGPAALSGALDGARGAGTPAAALAVLDGALDTGCPAARRSLCARVANAGCVLAELPCGSARRRWCALAAERLLAALADVTLVVESDDDALALAGARVASSLRRPLGAVPGRVSSRGARGPHALLRSGAHLVTRTSDVLDLLDDAGARAGARSRRGNADAYAGLDPLLRDVLERVGAGEDTPGRLLAGGRESAEALLGALGELELMGLLTRGDGARYVLRDPLARPPLRYGVPRQMEP